MSTRFEPFRNLTDEMNRLFGDVYRWDESVAKQGEWTPPVDIYETEQHDLIIKAELPDMTREDIEVTVEHNTLTLRGTKKLPSHVGEEQYRRIERLFLRELRPERGGDAGGATTTSDPTRPRPL